MGSMETIVKSCSASSMDTGKTCQDIYKYGSWFFSAENTYSKHYPTKREGEWVLVDFKQPIEIGKIKFKHHNDQYDMYSWKVDGYSLDKWLRLVTIKDVDNNDNEVKTYDVSK